MRQVNHADIAWRNAQLDLTTAKLSLESSLQGLSSDLPINSAKDDAKGLAIADCMMAQIRDSCQVVLNTGDRVFMANLTHDQILQKAGTVMLAQANVLPNGVLPVLR